MRTTVPVAPEVIRWAIERSERDDLHSAQISHWLDGSKHPTLKQLQAFAKRTSTPFGYFFLPVPPQESTPQESTHAIPDMRSGQHFTFSAKLRDTVSLAQSQQDWYRGYLEQNAIPHAAWLGRATLHTPVASAAQELATALSLRVPLGSERPLLNLIEATERAGILVTRSTCVGDDTRRQLRVDEFRGFALFDSSAPLIFLNANDSKTAQAFTLVHELGHLFLGSSALDDVASEDGSEIERWCNALAGELLVPSDVLLREWQTCRDEAKLATRFGVSLAVMQIRLHRVGLRASPARFSIGEVSPRKKPARGGGNYHSMVASRVGRTFARAVCHSLDTGTTTWTEAARLLAIRPGVVRGFLHHVSANE